MPRKQLIALFLCNLVPYTAGQALIGLLPVYAVQLGADEIMAGLYLSLSFGSLAVATLGSGWLSNRFQQRKRMIILAGAVGIPAAFLMGQVSSVALLTLFTMILWAVYGVITTMANILTGMYADPMRRGRIFGIMLTSNGVGAIIGGFASGAIVDRLGFPALFTLVALSGVIQVVVGLLLEDRAQTNTEGAVSAKATSSVPLSRTIWLLIAAHVFALTANFSANLGRPLVMDVLGFDASAITSTIAISGFFALPLPFIIGWLSDRLGRNRVLTVCYLAMGLGVVVLAPAMHLWHFWLSMILLTANVAALSVGLAYVNDLASSESLATAIARFSATPWIAGVIGYGATGFVIRAAGLQTTFLIAAVMPVISMLLLFAISRQPRPVQASAS